MRTWRCVISLPLFVKPSRQDAEQHKIIYQQEGTRGRDENGLNQTFEVAAVEMKSGGGPAGRTQMIVSGGSNG